MNAEDRQKLAAEIDEISRHLFNISHHVERLALRLNPRMHEVRPEGYRVGNEFVSADDRSIGMREGNIT